MMVWISSGCGAAARRLSTAAANSRDIYDVVINGGGMVGLALAACLRSNPLTHGLRVAVLDRDGFPPSTPFVLAPVPDLRVSTLTPASAQLLAGAGAWQHMAPPRCAPFHQMQVWDAAGGGHVRYDAHQIGQGALGYVAENSLIAASLAREVAAPGGNVELLPECSMASAELPPYAGGGGNAGLVALRLDGGRELRTRLLVGADGARSRVRELAGIRTRGREYGQRGVVATVAIEGEPTHVAWQRFLPTGPLALLPVRDGLCNIVWTTTPAAAKQLEALSPAEFAAAVNEALTSGGNAPPQGLAGLLRTLGGSSSDFMPPPRVVDRVGPSPRSFPLVLRHAGKYVRPRVALIGDAAHAVHPLAGQGVNLGFGDVRALALAIADAVRSGRDVGDLLLLEEAYEAPRRRANGVMSAALDGLQRMFTPPAGPLAAARSLGLSLVNASPTAKQTIMRYAMFGS